MEFSGGVIMQQNSLLPVLPTNPTVVVVLKTTVLQNCVAATDAIKTFMPQHRDTAAMKLIKTSITQRRSLFPVLSMNPTVVVVLKTTVLQNCVLS